MNFFEFINDDKFFNPLSSKNRKIYFDCIVNLIEKLKEVRLQSVSSSIPWYSGDSEKASKTAGNAMFTEDPLVQR